MQEMPFQIDIYTQHNIPGGYVFRLPEYPVLFPSTHTYNYHHVAAR
jgi:hypothetical protein